MIKDEDRIKNIVQPIIYHYTSFEKFMKIIEFGTFRFKLSTSSNDAFDTVYFHEVIKQILLEYSTNSSDEKSRLFKFILNYFERPGYESTEDTLVTCFSKICDSRLLWDAYTVNRPGAKCKYGENKSCLDLSMSQYNGVCICIDSYKFYNLLQNLKRELICNEIFFGPIYYDRKSQVLCLRYILEDAWEQYLKIKAEGNENQDIIPPILFNPIIDFGGYKFQIRPFEIALHKSFALATMWFISAVQRTAPFIKHEFWSEEQELRAVLCRNKKDNTLKGNVSGGDDDKYIDISITEEIFDSIIVGPTFSDSEMARLKAIANARLDIDRIKLQPSSGTGVIRNK